MSTCFNHTRALAGALLFLGAGILAGAQAATGFVDRHTRIAPLDGATSPVAPAASSPAQANESDVLPLDRIVAVVNKDIITASDLNDHLDLVEARLQAQGGTRLPPENVLRKQVLNRMILDKIELQLADRIGIRVDGAAVDRAMQNVAKRNNMDMDQFRQALKTQGIDFAQYRRDVKNQMILERLMQREVESRVSVTPEEEKAFIKQAGQQWGTRFNLQHIFISIPENATPAQVAERKAKAESLRAQLEQGANFAQLAIADSNGQDALQGGRLGEKRAGELPPDFVKVFDGMQPGQISPVLRSSGGFHLFKLLGKTVGKPTVTEAHVRHILLRADNPEQLAAAESRAAQIEKALHDGQDFAALAKEYSQDPASAKNGGDLGWIEPGQTVPAFDRAISLLKPGEISPPVRSRYGIHIIQLLGTRQHEIGAQDMQQAARTQLMNRKTQERMEQWLRELRDGAYVRILDPSLAAS